jgi:hypothetical protein
MNTFTILFKNAQGEWVTEIMELKFHSVQGVLIWFEDIFGLRIASISKH